MNRIQSLILSIGLLFIAVISVPAFFGPHWSWNLEPYPDGLIYVVPALNLVTNLNYNLHYLGTAIKPNVPPLYSSILSLGFVLFKNPITFYAINILLLLASTTIFFYTLKNFFKKPLLIIVGLAIFLGHSILIWQLGLPMSENLGLFLFCLLSFALLNKQKSAKNFFFGITAATLLFFVKYSYLPVTVLAGSYFLITNLDYLKQKRNIAFLFFGGVLMLIIFVSYQFWSGSNPFAFIADLISQKSYQPKNVIESNATLAAVDQNKIVFFSPSFIWPNVKYYLLSVLGLPKNYLWLKTSFSSLIIFLLAISGSVLAFKKPKYSQYRSLTLVFFAQFASLLTFYVADNRYQIGSIVILSLLSLPTTEFIYEKSKKIAWLVFGLIIIAHLINQAPLWKTIISNNILHRSRAWQYEASKTAINFFNNQQDGALLISALPPFLITAYQPNINFELAPLSASQEYLAKKQQVWGGEYNREELREDYKILLAKDRKIFISNAYITHQQVVINDYEDYKNEFIFTEVASGCDNACNIYQLELR